MTDLLVAIKKNVDGSVGGSVEGGLVAWKPQGYWADSLRSYREKGGNLTGVQATLLFLVDEGNVK